MTVLRGTYALALGDRHYLNALILYWRPPETYKCHVFGLQATNNTKPTTGIPHLFVDYDRGL